MGVSRDNLSIFLYIFILLLTQNYFFGRIARVCCYATITGTLVTSYVTKTNIIGKYVTQVKPVYIYDTIQKASLNIQTLSKTAT